MKPKSIQEINIQNSLLIYGYYINNLRKCSEDSKDFLCFKIYYENAVGIGELKIPYPPFKINFNFSNFNQNLTVDLILYIREQVKLLYPELFRGQI